MIAAVALGHVPLTGWTVLLACAGLGSLLGALASALVRLLRRLRPHVGALGFSALLALGGGAWLGLGPAGPSVIIIVVDCMRADRLDTARSPRFMALARTGWRFLQARAQAPWTRSSVPSLLSGRMPAEHGMYRVRPAPDRLRDGVRLIAEDFQDAGWSTAAFAQQGQLDRAFGLGVGYDRYGTRDGSVQQIAAKVLSWNALHRTLPRYLYVHVLDAHGPHWASPAFRPKNPPPTSLEYRGMKAWRETIVGIRNGSIRPTASDFAHVAAQYDGEIREIDHVLGRMLARMEADGTLDRAWLVLTADHGELLGEHGDVEHMRTPWEVLLHVPLVIRPPGGLAEGAEIEAMVQHVDLVPTLLTAAGLPARDGLAGRDLGPLLRGETLPEVPSFAEEWSRPLRRAAVRWHNWKWIREGEQGRLYDLAADPGERTDLAAERPDQVAVMEGLLDEYFAAAAEGRPLSAVDWEAAARSGRTWAPGAEERPDAAAAEAVDEDVMEQLRNMGYLDE